MAARIASRFRKSFEFSKESANWFPGHMAKGVKQMQQKLKMVDCIIEVHDARIPFSGRNPNFYHLLTASKPHVLVLNKKDLSNLRHRERVDALLRDKMNDAHVVYTDCHREGCLGVRKVLPKTIELIKSSERFNRSEAAFHVMVIGIPNVGKSSLINSLRNLHLRKANATSVGAMPGVTRSVMNKIKICDEPTIYLFDTPGILQPNITNAEIGLKLALCATIQDTVVSPITMADFLLYWMNRHENFNYVEYMRLKEPTDDIYGLLIHSAAYFNRFLKIRNFDGLLVDHPDLVGVSNYFLKAFQSGHLGKFMLDVDLVRKYGENNEDEGDKMAD